jgi:hypothetical protein
VAKVKETIVSFSGTIGNDVFVDSKTYGAHRRSRPRPGSKKNEPALKKVYKRTKYLNALASGINKAIEVHCGSHKDGQFYPELLKRFRSESSDNRFLLLSTLRDIDVNPRYNLEALKGDHKVFVKAGKQKINVDVNVLSQPKKESGKSDCYCYGLVLLTWNKTDDTPTYESQYTEWMPFNNGKPEFEFSFPKRPGVVHWLLCLRQQLGFHEEPFSFTSEGMRIIQVGTFLKSDEALLNKRNAAKKVNKKSPSTQKQDKIVRVKPKKKR